MVELFAFIIWVLIIMGLMIAIELIVSFMEIIVNAFFFFIWLTYQILVVILSNISYFAVVQFKKARSYVSEFHGKS